MDFNVVTIASLYSTYVKEKETVGCFLLLHVIATNPKLK